MSGKLILMHESTPYFKIFPFLKPLGGWLPPPAPPVAPPLPSTDLLDLNKLLNVSDSASTVCTLLCKTLLPCVIVYNAAYRPVAMLEARPHDLAESTGQISHLTCNILYDLNSQNNRNTHLYSQLMTQIV